MPGITLMPFTVEPRKFHELIIMPQFGDYLDGDILTPSPEEGDWSVMDNVVVSRPIIELRSGQNILKRRDATCKLIYSPVGKLGARTIKTEPLYAAAEDCVREFYQGCFADYKRENWKVFGKYIMPIMEKAVAADLYVNKYFGDVTRLADVTGRWSWNKFDGVFTQLAKYIGSGALPSDQTFTLPSGELSPGQAYAALKEAYDRQGEILDLEDDDEKAFYVNKKLYNAYEEYLKIGGLVTIAEKQGQEQSLKFKGIEIKKKKWDGPLRALHAGTAAHAVILTLRGNWIYATDSDYGGGPEEDEAIRVFYDQHDDIWKRQIHMKAGTEWANPTLVVLGLTPTS